MSNEANDGRFDWLREELSDFRQETREGQRRIEEKLENLEKEHENRLRNLEDQQAQLEGGMRFLKTIGALLFGAITLGVAVMQGVKSWFGKGG